jgi:hypothetical protein
MTFIMAVHIRDHFYPAFRFNPFEVGEEQLNPRQGHFV